MEFLNAYAAGAWVAGGVAAGILLIFGASLIRAVSVIQRYGWSYWLRDTFRVDSDTWRLVGALLFVAMVLLVLRSRMG